MKIVKTTNYNRFKGISGNRQVRKYHVDNIKGSIAKRNLLHVNPIIVNGKMQVIDGQHRLAAAKSLKVPVYYIVENNIRKDDIINLNANMRTWSSDDYIDFYIKQGNTDYAKLRDFMNQYELPTTRAVNLLTESSGWGREWYDFKSGTFKVTAEQKAHDFAEKLTELRPYVRGHSWKSSNFSSALKKVYEQVPHKDLMTLLKSQGTTIQLGDTVRDYLREFERVVNWKKITNTIHFY